MFNEDLYNRLTVFGFVHLLTLAVLSAIIVIFYFIRQKIAGPKFTKVFRISLGVFLLVFEMSYHIWVYSRGGYWIGMLPLFGFCAFTNLLTIIALLVNKPKMFNYLIYYAIVGAFFSLVFVDTTWTIPHYRFFHYFLVHFGFLMASLYYYFTNRITINFKNFLNATLALLGYTLIMLVLSIIMHENWFFLFENPVKAISDALGAPFYTILWLLFILLFMTFTFFMLSGFKLKKAHAN